MTTLDKIKLPDYFQYITAFVTMACPLNCSYCSNKLQAKPKGRNTISAEKWIQIFNRLDTDLSIILFGGEPLAHPEIYEIINGVNPKVKFEMLSVFPFNIDDFLSNVSPDRFIQDLPYPSIRISFHPEEMDLDQTIQNALQLQKAGFGVVITFVNHPSVAPKLLNYKKQIESAGLLCAIRPYFGKFEGSFHGHIKYKDSIDQEKTKSVKCKPHGFYIDPLGDTYSCRTKTLIQKYEDKIGNLLDPEFVAFEDKYYDCDLYGQCNLSDITFRRDRYKKWGFCSVDIKGKEVEVLPTPENADWID